MMPDECFRDNAILFMLVSHMNNVPISSEPNCLSILKIVSSFITGHYRHNIQQSTDYDEDTDTNTYGHTLCLQVDARTQVPNRHFVSTGSLYDGFNSLHKPRSYKILLAQNSQAYRVYLSVCQSTGPIFVKSNGSVRIFQCQCRVLLNHSNRTRTCC